MKIYRYLIPFSLIISFLNVFLRFLFENSCTFNDGVSFGLDVGTYIQLIMLLVCLILSFISGKEYRGMFLSVFILGSFNYIERIIYGNICDYIPLFNLKLNLIDMGISTVVLISIVELIYENINRKRK